MGLKLTREAEAQAESLVQTARGEGERLVREAIAAALQARRSRLADRERGLRRETAARLDRVRDRGAGSLLEARHAAVERILTQVESLLPGLSDDSRCAPSFTRDLDAAFQVVEGPPGGDAGVLTAAPAVARLARAAAGVRGTAIEVRTDPGVAGFILRSGDGRIEVDGTLQQRFRRRRSALAIAAAAALREQGQP